MGSGQPVLRRLLPLVVLTAGSIVLAGAWVATRPRGGDFSFETFEGDGRAVRVAEAKAAIETLVPIGSALSRHERFFRSLGGTCGIVSGEARYPHTAICAYDHGFAVSAGWRYAVDYDPATMRSRHTELSFALTGP